MVKHHSRAVAVAVRALSAWPYLVRALGAAFVSGHEPRRYLLHARQALTPWRGMGLREAAEARNRTRGPRAAIQLRRSTTPGSTGGL